MTSNDWYTLNILMVICSLILVTVAWMGWRLDKPDPNEALDMVSEFVTEPVVMVTTNSVATATNEMWIRFTDEMVRLADVQHDEFDEMLWEAAVSESLLTIAATNTRHIPSASEIRRAMNEYRRLNPLCEICWAPHSTDGTAIQVHHRIPKHVNIYIAADHTNFWGGCRRHHWQVGHGIFNGGGFHKYNINLDETADAIRQGFTNNARFIK